MLWNARPTILPMIVHESFCGALVGSLENGSQMVVSCRRGLGHCCNFGTLVSRRESRACLCFFAFFIPCLYLHLLSLPHLERCSSPFSQWPSLWTKSCMFRVSRHDGHHVAIYVCNPILPLLVAVPAANRCLLSLGTTIAMSTPLRTRQTKMGSCLQRRYTRIS